MDLHAPAPATARWFATMPKAELHLHIEGTLTPERMLTLAQRNGIRLPYQDVDAVRAAYAFDSLQSFLDLYYQGMSVLRTEADFYALTMDYLTVCRRERILHAEIGFDPQGHTERGVPLEVVFAGIQSAIADARQQWGQSTSLIMNFLRHLPAASALETLEAAQPHLHALVAVGLDSSESGFPPEPFAPVFERAAQQGLKKVAHAGEEGPPAYIWGAIRSLGVQRIDHGIRAEEDPQLLSYLAEQQLPLTVCPLSNVQLCAVANMAEHNVLRLLRAGLCVTLNSDDPSYFGGYLSDNYAAVAADLGMTIAEAATLARNSFTASFLPTDAQQQYLSVVDQWCEEAAATPREAP